MNEREFTEDQMKAGQTIIGLQAGQNKGKTYAALHVVYSRLQIAVARKESIVKNVSPLILIYFIFCQILGATQAGQNMGAGRKILLGK